ncbi:hypothetical protein SPSYN_02965 [Sporotomaculum syntrophicum]|uniref:Sporulation protein YyaC n=2 Tax=Sporotomaculum syntrophicum TaxID=182264 RepID=A0A9D2WMB4_9FIRM|nr:hypothetical protein SPSYN_02965 [Sporotomaculum syntrophicum]
MQQVIEGITKYELFEVYKRILVVCIGTNEIIGDSLGPLVGTMLRDRGFRNVWGTLDKPIGATKVAQYASILPKDKETLIIGVDALNAHDVNLLGYLCVKHAPIWPASSIKQIKNRLPPIGNVSVGMVVTHTRENESSLEYLNAVPKEMIYIGANKIADALEATVKGK